MRWGDWTSGKREAPEPLEGNVVATILVGVLTWGVLFVAQVPFYGWYADHGHEWWIWTCLAGSVCGLPGLWYVRRRDAAIRAARTPEPEDGPAAD